MTFRGWRAAAVVLASCPWGAGAAEPTAAEEDAFRAAVERVAAAVVRIEPVAGTRAALTAAAEAGAASSPSTGLVIDPAGLVLTTAFAVPDDATEAVVVLPGGERQAAKPRGRDRVRGIVLLETAAIPAAPTLDVVRRSDLEPGQWTIGVGRGWSAAEPSVAVGILSAVDRGWGLAVQTDAAVSPMNYGGPLVDIAGRVIGILAPLPGDTADMKRGTELYDSGIGFAVPLEDVLPDVPRLRAGESLVPGILGISYRSRDAINGEPVIASVRQGSPAARAGLRSRDRIVSIDDRRVSRIADVRHGLVPRHAGDEVAITVERAGDDAAAATVATRATLVAALPPWKRAVLGLIVVADKTGHEAGGQDVAARIAWVLPGGPADRAGIVAGVAVESIAAVPEQGIAPVGSPSAAALAGFLAGMEPGQTVRIGLDQDGTKSSATVVLADMPGEVPDSGPPADGSGVDPLAGPTDSTSVVRLEAAEIADPPVAVIPGGREPVPVLIYCGPPHGPVAEAEGAAWKAAVAASGVAVILPGSTDRRQWSRDDLPGVLRGIQSLTTKRPVDTGRIAVAGTGPGGGFAWLVAEQLGTACVGVAVADATRPRQVVIDDAQPGAAKWILLGPGAGDPGRRLVDDRRELSRAGHAVGSLPDAADGGPPTAILCRWASLLGLL